MNLNCFSPLQKYVCNLLQSVNEQVLPELGKSVRLLLEKYQNQQKTRFFHSKFLHLLSEKFQLVCEKFLLEFKKKIEESDEELLYDESSKFLDFTQSQLKERIEGLH